jgi:RHS repeat-associated protein
VNVVTDRLGSVRANTQGEKFAYYPYGEERTVTVDGREKFGTYFRDGVGQDYAMARYYGSGTGRYWSPDPSGMKAAEIGNPIGWNMYAYVNGDPVNHSDPTGRYECVDDDGEWVDDGEGEACGHVGEVTDYYGNPSLVFSTTVAPSGLIDGTFYLNGVPLGELPLEDADLELIPALAALSAAEGWLVSLPGDAPPTILGSSYALSAEGTLLPGYVQIAGMVGGQALNVPTAVWNSMSLLDQHATMVTWIDGALAADSQIIFTSNPALAAQGSGLLFEYNYITEDLGLEVVQSGTSWVVNP